MKSYHIHTNYNIENSMAKKIKSIQKCFTIIELLASSASGMGVLELAEKSDLPSATVHRILRTLLAEGYVQQDHLTEHYLLTAKMFEVGSRVFRDMDLRSCAVPVLKELTNRTEETSSLYVLSGQKGLCIEVIESRKWHRVCPHLGELVPLHCTAAGKILLAFGAISVLDLKLERYTQNTIRKPQMLQEHLKKVRESGIAMDMEEFEIGIRCIAAPVRNHKGDSVAAVSVTGPKEHLAEKRIKDVSMEVVAAADNISSKLGFSSS